LPNYNSLALLEGTKGHGDLITAAKPLLNIVQR